MGSHWYKVLRLWLWALQFCTCQASTANDCTLNQEGSCRPSNRHGFVEICASLKWIEMTSGNFYCTNGHLLPHTMTNGALASPSTIFANHKPPKLNMGITNSTDLRTGFSVCNSDPSATQVRVDPGHGIATYNTTMASVYDADRNSVFRCNLPAPANDWYVAVWTPYDDDLVSQPQPLNCGGFLNLTNPYLGKSAVAQVIDRCASCVGVNHQLDDPTVPDSLVNGATVDLSRELWRYLFDFPVTSDESSVFDIQYNGTKYGGACDSEKCTFPQPLTSPTCAE